MRIERRAERLASIWGRTTCLNCSNGFWSRKNDDSLVVIASVMSRSSASSRRVRMATASSSRPFMFHLRATGISRDSSR
mgnify:CR=1 FL=1